LPREVVEGGDAGIGGGDDGAGDSTGLPYADKTLADVEGDVPAVTSGIPPRVGPGSNDQGGEQPAAFDAAAQVEGHHGVESPALVIADASGPGWDDGDGAECVGYRGEQQARGSDFRVEMLA
jgi:hypothetical protein